MRQRERLIGIADLCVRARLGARVVSILIDGLQVALEALPPDHALAIIESMEDIVVRAAASQGASGVKPKNEQEREELRALEF